MEPVELRKHFLELLFGDVLRYVANVEGKHLCFRDRRQRIIIDLLIGLKLYLTIDLLANYN